jgi:hypothetical protein
MGDWDDRIYCGVLVEEMSSEVPLRGNRYAGICRCWVGAEGAVVSSR